MPMVSKKPMKSFGRCYDASLKDYEQVHQLKQDVNSGLKNFDQTMLPGKLKLWCLQFGLSDQPLGGVSCDNKTKTLDDAKAHN